MDVSLWLWFAVLGLILGMLAIDLFAHRRAHVIGVREAAGWSAVWVAIGVAFGVYVWSAFGAGFGTALGGVMAARCTTTALPPPRI